MYIKRKFLLNSNSMPTTLFIVNRLKVDISFSSLTNEPLSSWQVQSLSLRLSSHVSGSRLSRSGAARSVSWLQRISCVILTSRRSNYLGFNDGGPWLHPKAWTVCLLTFFAATSSSMSHPIQPERKVSSSNFAWSRLVVSLWPSMNYLCFNPISKLRKSNTQSILRKTFACGFKDSLFATKFVTS